MNICSQEGNKSEQETQDNIHAQYNKRNIKTVRYHLAFIILADFKRITIASFGIGV